MKRLLLLLCITLAFPVYATRVGDVTDEGVLSYIKQRMTPLEMAVGLVTDHETVTVDGAASTYGVTVLDNTSTGVDVTLADGDSDMIGQRKTFIVSNADNAATVTIASHKAGTNHVETLSTVGDTLELVWNGTNWENVTYGTYSQDLTLDDGSGASPSIILKDATNETTTISKVDSGYTTITTEAADGVSIRTGNLTVGNGTAGTAAMDGEDAYIEGELEVDGAVELDGAVNIDGALSTTSSVSTTGDVTITVGDGANGDLKELTGLWRVRDWSVGASSDGTAQTVTTDLMPDTTEDANWTATANMTVAENTSLERVGSSSLQITVGSSPADGNGADNPLGSGDQDWTADESVGMWMRCDTTTSAGDWVLEITDSVAGATEVNVPALSTADTWTWLEIDISGVADASKDVITDIALDVSAAGASALPDAVCLFDFMVKWDAASEEALGIDVLEGSIPTALAVVTATGGNRIPVVIDEYTDYFIHYETNNDFFIPITDQSGNSVWGRAAIE